MKSPLVEALRQANGHSDATDNAESGAAGAESPVREPGEGSGREQSEGGNEFAESLEIMASESEPLAFAGDPDADVEGSAALQVEAGGAPQRRDSGDGGSVGTVVVAADAATRASRAPRIARLAPLLCIGAALASGALHFAYQWIGGDHENADLEVMSAKEPDRAGMLPDNDLLVPPARFKLLVDPAAAGAAERRERGLRAGLAEPASTLP